MGADPHPRCGFAALALALLALGLNGCQDGQWPWQKSTQRSPSKAPRTSIWNRPPKQERIHPPDPAKVWPPRAVWVVRQAYRSPDEIAELMEKCQQAGINTVLFQVRGNGTLFCRSRIEPLAYEYRNGDPGFDPLEVACQEAHRRGMALHAWVNVTPAWRGAEAPSDPDQLYNAHPEWFLYDQKGRRQPLSPNFYVSLNPCLPEVREYLSKVFSELVRNYPIDGLHMDYIRFPVEESPKGSDYPYDRQTLELYSKTTGLQPRDNATAWTHWRTAQVTELVREINASTRRIRPGLRITASCAPEIEQARKRYFQDGPGWLREKLIDLVFVMNYTGDNETFSNRQATWKRAVGRAWVAAGISLTIPASKSSATTIQQIRMADQWGHGFALFSAGSLFSDSPRARALWEELVPVLRSSGTGQIAEATPRF